MHSDLILRGNAHFYLLLLLWMCSSLYLVSAWRKECSKVRYKTDTKDKQNDCRQDPKPPKRDRRWRDCTMTCNHKLVRWRRPQRIGQEANPELIQYPENPDFTDDTRFCLVFDDLQYEPETDVTYRITMGNYSCTLLVWTACSSESASDVVKKPSRFGPASRLFARFGMHLYGNYERVTISTDYGRLKQKSWDFEVSKRRQVFSGGIDHLMGPCMEALEIEGAARFPDYATAPTDHCVFQTFKLSYPQVCTSLSFEGGWKRGQTVTLSKWTFSLVQEEVNDKCVDIGATKKYRVISEFTDRHIYISPRQMRGGLNRLCNDFLFTATFGTENNMKDYGPYDIKICGYLLVDPKPCIQILPLVEELEITHVAFGVLFILDAHKTIEDGQPRAKYGFEWTCQLVINNASCGIVLASEPVLSFEVPQRLGSMILRLTLTVTHYPNSQSQTSATESRLLSVVNPHSLHIHISCLSNCNHLTVSVHPVVLRVVCENQCQNPDEFKYKWTLYQIVDGNREVVDHQNDLDKYVDNGQLTTEVFSTTGSGNIFLEKVFIVCINMSRVKGFGYACHRMDYRGAPLPFEGDGCIITPYNAELPGFLSHKYHGLCIWRKNTESLRYKVFTYDVGHPLSDRQYDLVAFSDIPRLPDLEMPFGNPEHDFQLGVVFMISNDNDLTYVYDVKESFDKIGVKFKVRKPMDFTYLGKVEDIANQMLDRKKSSHFGSRQGTFNVAGLVASVIDTGTERHASGISKAKRQKIRQTVMLSLVALTDSEKNTVLQLTPIIDSLTRQHDEMSNEMEETGAEVLLPLTEGLSSIAVTDYKTASRLSKLQYTVLERINKRNTLRQQDAFYNNISKEKKAHFVEQASKYSQMYMNIGAGMAASTLSPDTPKVQESPRSAIAVSWIHLRPNSTLIIKKPRSNHSEFGSTIHVNAESLNLSPGTEVNLVMTVNANNLFVFGNGTEKINMPMVNMEIKFRGSSKTVDTSNLSIPADIFIERTVASLLLDEWTWQRINLTVNASLPVEPINPCSSGGGGGGVEDGYYYLAKVEEGGEDDDPDEGKAEYRLCKRKGFVLPASDTHNYLLKFNLSHPGTFTIRIAAYLLYENGSKKHEILVSDYPLQGDQKSYQGLERNAHIVFLPRWKPSPEDDSNASSYIISFFVESSNDSTHLYTKQNAPFLSMLMANISCETWNHQESTWTTSGCDATEFSNFDVLHCQCNHLSIFSGGILVPANPLVLTDFKLFSEFFKNPAIVSIVCFIWLVYFILVYWATDEDWLDTFRSRVAVLEDNQLSDDWAYLVCCVTGWWINSGSTAKVFIYLKGTKGLSRVHRLKDDEQQLFQKGAENWFVLTTPNSLGKLKSVVVWHDSSGDSPAWFLKEVFVQDINQGDSWHCLYNDWISVEHGSGDLCVEVPALTPEEIHRMRLYQTVLKTSLAFRNGHIWLSIVLKPPYSPFTRVQRLTCALCILLTTMLSNLMFYDIPTTNPEEQVSSGPLRLDLYSLVKGIQSSLVVIPINMLLVQLFTRTSLPPSHVNKHPMYTFDETKLVDMEDTVHAKEAMESSDMHLETTTTMSKMSIPRSLAHPSRVSSSLEEHSHEEEEEEEEEDSSYLGTSSDSSGSQAQHKNEGGLRLFSMFSFGRRKSRNVTPTTSHLAVFSTQACSSASQLAASASYAEADLSASATCPDDNAAHVHCVSGTRDMLSPCQTGSEEVFEFASLSPDLLSAASTKSEISVDELRFETEDHGDNVPNRLNTNHSALDANNSAVNEGTNTAVDMHRGRPSFRRMSQQFSLITTTRWFQSAVSFLRDNVDKMTKERTKRNQEGCSLRDSKALTNQPGLLDTGAEKLSGAQGSTYFDRLKRKAPSRSLHPDAGRGAQESLQRRGTNFREGKLPGTGRKLIAEREEDAQTASQKLMQRRRETQETETRSAEETRLLRMKQHRQRDSTTMSDIFLGGGGDRKESSAQGKSSKLSYLDKLKAKRENENHDSSEGTRKEEETATSQLDDTASTGSQDSAPKGCWFCSTVPSYEHTRRHVEIERKRQASGRTRDPSGKDKEPPEEFVSFEAIRQDHEFEYQRALKKGPRALRSFKRQAAQCIAEDIVNFNRNAATSKEGEGQSAKNRNFNRKADPKNVKRNDTPGCCKSCMESCQSCVVATFVCIFMCQCPRKSKIPWWMVYLTWVLALSVALFSSWVVMLYGLRLGYQRSVDWLSAFFTGWFQNVMVIQPIKVVALSLLWTLVLKQHVNVREEAGISVHDENEEPMHIRILKDMEARKRMLDGMWTTTDYAYPIPRSKAKDIKLRLEQDARARLILRESLLWALFLLTVTITAMGHTSVEKAYYTNHILKAMLTEGTDYGIGFEDVSDTRDVWAYTLDSLLPVLFSDPNRTTANNVSLVFGSMRLRQIRQKYDTDFCAPFVENRFFRDLRGSNHCYPYFHVLHEERRDFNHSWATLADKDTDALKGLTPRTEAYMLTSAWLYQSAFQLEESPKWGQRAMYPGGGYIVDVPRDFEFAEKALTDLQDMQWLNHDTRALVISANLYTPSKDLITVFTILCEWTQEGPVFMSLDLHTSKLHWYASDYESYTASAEIGWMLMMSYNMYQEMLEVMRVGVYDYLKSPWTYLELVNFFLSLTAIAAQMARIVLVDIFRDKVVDLMFDHYVSFAGPAFLDDMLDLLKALIFVSVTLKVFKVLRFNRYFRILLQSFYIARHSILNQVLVAFILFMAFGFACKILFGPFMEDFKSLESTLLALLNFGLGEGDFEAMYKFQPMLGPLIYFLFIVFFTILTVSFFVTFVLESFNVSRVFVQLNAEEQHVIRYVKRVWRLLIGATPKIKKVKRRRRTHPFKAASYTPNKDVPS